ncbi:putative oxidoreductase YdgJ [Limihaloglobus sulfuriphilus]|uniref:Putative oxidoreductase YdgJ n=1 Tax=Limihaloglobus sulfuriphilus TaxID=1851148 RepID=A0A1Q2MBP1_9BACT|nr:Gfo/Idh/MocA family oxidoreductase [Limihaloglobus sulfuriphilus]AQQ70133.1 putative oxidoreductase YdgJ [Limihaloglobus sulfuriphilus]
MGIKIRNIGIVGCGKICDIYFQTLSKLENVDVRACADLVLERAEEKAAKYNIPRACTVEEIMASDDIEIILNLTVPAAHYSIAKQALEAGKHVYNEKPFTNEREQGLEILELADKKGLLTGCAPDTVMGAGIQTCRKLIDEGAIGRPLSFTAFMTSSGTESWHPDPEFYYKTGGGPLFDMAPYYLSALITLLGPVHAVSGMASMPRKQRMITSEPKKGQIIDVEVDTHVMSLIEMECRAMRTMVMSFDIWQSSLPRIEIYGSEGSLSVPDPNGFGGVVKLYTKDKKQWQDIGLIGGFAENSRGIGVADMAACIDSGYTHCANGRMAYHVLDTMHSIINSSNQSKTLIVRSSCTKPRPFRQINQP